MNISIAKTMDKITEVPEDVNEFLAGPLVTWFTSCLEMITDEKVTYDNLVNGYLIHNVFLQMNLQVHDTNVYPSTVDSVAWRSRNLVAVLSNIRHFYEDELDQAILRAPDVEKLGREPEHHLRECEILLELLLGCAVQCPRKQTFIEMITQFDEVKQLAVAECIEQVIEVPGIVLSAEMLIEPTSAEKIIKCVRQICRERDDYQAQLRRRRELDEEHASDDFCEKLQLKFKATSLDDQLRLKNDELDDVRAELTQCENKLRDLTKTYEKLALEAINVTLYEDKLDEVNASAEKSERLEQEIARYQEKLSDFDVCRARLRELEKSNKFLLESKASLEKQLASLKAEREKAKNLKKQVTRLTEQMNNLSTENAENRNKYWMVCQEKTELQRLVKESYKQPRVNHRFEGIPSVRDDLLLNHANDQVDKLQADNKKLASFIETLKQKLIAESDSNAALTRENKKLTQIVDTLNAKINSLNENYSREVIRNKSLEGICRKAKTALNEAEKMHQQGLKDLRSQLERKAQNRSSIVDKSIPNNPTNVVNKRVDEPTAGKKFQKFDVSTLRKQRKSQS